MRHKWEAVKTGGWVIARWSVVGGRRSVFLLLSTVYCLLSTSSTGGQGKPQTAPQGKSLLILAPRAFHPALKEFVAWKSRLLPTRLAALEEALSRSKGADDPERLKQFLYREWKPGKLGYVLLVGDVDVLPVRYMVLDRVTKEAFDYAFYPSDLYYADLAKPDGRFEDWNAGKEGFHARYFGEVRGEKNKQDPINYDQVDYRPEIAVGRWPVRTSEEAARIAGKSIKYEKALLSGEKPGLRTAALFSVGGWVDSRPLFERLAQALGERWTVERRFYRDGPRNAQESASETAPPTEKELYALLDQGAGLVLHAGHGDSDRWEQCCSITGLLRVGNADRLPVLVSAGCSTAYFAPLAPYDAYTDVDGKSHKGTYAGEVFGEPPPPPNPYQKEFNPTGLGEAALLRGENGAVAYIGCNTGSQPCGLTLVEGFALALARDKEPRLGDAWASAVRHYFEKERLADLKPNDDWYPPSIFFQGMKFMVFGDPSLRLPGAK